MGINYLTEYKTLWEKKTLLTRSNFFFSYNVFKRGQLLMHQNEYLLSKGLTHVETRCVYETLMPRNGHFLRNVTLLFDLDLGR